MKLIFCSTCMDVFKLTYELRSCKCGKCVGRYDEDGCNSVTNGIGHALAIGNGSLYNAVMSGKSHFPDEEDRITFLAWTRPNDGPKNPYSRIDLDLKMETT